VRETTRVWAHERRLTVSYERIRLPPTFHDASKVNRFVYSAESADVLETQAPTTWERLGFRFNWTSGVWTTREVAAPLWFIASLCCAATAMPARWLWRNARRDTLKRQGMCATCGYDLRGAAHERCPECGGDVEPVSRTHRGLPPAAAGSRAAGRPGASP
jgi:hypothetical protein